MSIFIDCIVSQDYGKLVTSGQPSEADLAKAWLHLYSEYCQRVNDPHTQELLEKRQQIDVLQSRLRRLGYLLQVASQVAAEEISEAFAAEGFLLDCNADDEKYLQQLRVISAKLIPDSMKLDRLISEAGQPKDAKQATRETFFNSMIEISDHVKYRITIDDITTGEYCMRIARLRDFREAEQRAFRKHAA